MTMIANNTKIARVNSFSDEATSSSLNEDHPNGVLTECRVCNGITNRNHYGIATCNACAAFFRRSIIQRRNYFCPKHDCKINDVEGPKKTCKSCRFNKCVKAGMLIDAVWRRKLLEESDQFCSSSIMQKMLKSRQAAYVNKVNVMSKLSIKLNIKMEMGQTKPSKEQTELSKISEFEVLMIYIKDVGLEEMGLDQSDMARVAAAVYYRWLLLSAIIVTLRNSGTHTNTAYFSDRGHITAVYSECEDFLRNHGVPNLEILANSWHKVLKKGLLIAKNVHQHRLDKTEFAMLTLLLILTQAKEMFPSNKEISAQLDALFKEMNAYFKENYSDTAMRLGALVLMINDINSIHESVYEFSNLLIISGYDIILHRVQRSYGILN